MKLTDKVHVAAMFADMLFTDKGQRYGNLPYAAHLQAVHDVLLRFDVIDRNMLAAAWLHDILEDTEVKEATLQDLFGNEVMALVMAVTDEKGKDRHERKALTYPKIRSTPGATQLKLADRIANVEMSIDSRNERQYRMYRREAMQFTKELRVVGEHDDMWNHLTGLMIRGERVLINGADDDA